MFKILIIFFILTFYTPAFSFVKDKIVSQMQLTNNLSFNFIQMIDGQSEEGSCIIEYPKKIYCEYNNPKNKIMVSNGKSLVIKNRNKKNYYVYPLKNTPLKFLLDKNYLISKINTLEPRNVNNKYLNFQIFENDNRINIFFDIKTSLLTGWQTKDIYDNLTITFISSIEVNKKINNKIFTLPENN
tara:strand:- start:208 stop:762 length:555 start_codon:yes stop_codon:yes gene_type:complete